MAGVDKCSNHKNKGSIPVSALDTGLITIVPFVYTRILPESDPSSCPSKYKTWPSNFIRPRMITFIEDTFEKSDEQTKKYRVAANMIDYHQSVYQN